MNLLRLCRLAAVALVVILASVLVAAPASAQYIPPGVPRISISGPVNGSITVTGTGFAPGENVCFTVDSQPPVCKLADANGTVTVVMSTASLGAGRHTVTASGPVSGSVTAYFFISPPGPGSVTPPGATASGAASPGGSGRSSGLGGLSFTGSNAIVPLALGGVLLILLGFGAVVLSRRRTRR